MAALLVGSRLANGNVGVAASAFRAAFSKGVTITWDPNCDGCRNGHILKKVGKACGSNYTSLGCVPGGGVTAGHAITFASMSNDAVDNFIHEMGHVYDNSLNVASNNPGAVLNRDVLRPNSCDGCYEWQQHPPSMDAAGSGSYETFGDTFIAWVYDAWNPEAKTSQINAVRDWMNGLVP
jgi:hypothetical protein